MPSKIYRNPTSKGFTRREFMKSVPSSFISFKVGGLDDCDATSFLGIEFVERNKQVSRRCIESLRIIANREVQSSFGVKTKEYKLNLLIYPFQVERKNKAPTGAGADRISSGMRQAFGKNEMDMARIRKANQRFLSIRFLRDIMLNPVLLHKVINSLEKKLNSSSYIGLRVTAHPIAAYQDWLSKRL